MSDPDQPAADGPSVDEFDAYCEAHNIQPGEEPAAFAAFLHELSGGTWDGRVEQVDGDAPGQDGPLGDYGET